MASKQWIPLVFSVLSGAIVSSQVYLAQRPPKAGAGRRVLVAIRDVASGNRLHPRDFKVLARVDVDQAGVVDDALSHHLWGRILVCGLGPGELLTVDCIGKPLPERVSGKKRALGVEILEEVGEL